jgi:hypothetical protein
MNLAAHAVAKGSGAELQFLADRFAWALDLGSASQATTDPVAAGQARLTPLWPSDEQAVLSLQPASGPTWVLFRESDFPEWSASVIDASGRRQPVAIVPAEMDYMLVRLDRVGAGARLEFDYSPSIWAWSSWAVSAGVALMLVLWCVRPGLFVAAKAVLRRRAELALNRGRDTLVKRLGSEDD